MVCSASEGYLYISTGDAGAAFPPVTPGECRAVASQIPIQPTDPPSPFPGEPPPKPGPDPSPDPGEPPRPPLQ